MRLSVATTAVRFVHRPIWPDSTTRPAWYITRCRACRFTRSRFSSSFKFSRWWVIVLFLATRERKLMNECVSSCNLLDVSSNIHLEAIMNIPEWQAKMIRTSPKSIMKHATKQLEQMSNNNPLPGNGSFKDDVKHHGLARSVSHLGEKKARKCNIDAVTGKRKYTKRFLKLDGILTNSKCCCGKQPSGVINNAFAIPFAEMKERKKHRKRRGSMLVTGPNGGANAVPRKYTFKKRIRKLNSVHFSDNLVQHSHVLNGVNGTADKHFEPISRSKNSSPVPNHRSERWDSLRNTSRTASRQMYLICIFRTQSDTRRSRNNYDIDNIVIPYSVAASTRVEVLTYKEIPTPK